jgi:hypothetical protein
MTQVVDGGVAVEHLQQEQPQRHQRREQTVPPLNASLLDDLIDPLPLEILIRILANARDKQLNSHPWPPVGRYLSTTILTGGVLRRKCL